MTVAEAGKMLSINAKVARRSRAMASWSVTYGMTEEQTPTATPASSQPGWSKAGAELVDSAPLGAVTRSGVGDPVGKSHVEHEQRAVRKGEPEPEWRAGQPDVGEGEHAGHGEPERERVTQASDPHTANTRAALTILSQVTPSTSSRANSSTANAGPR
ncbi:hypothetical protein Prum_072210 [Phytohabitans rumicis]|uniref:Uncharacterized protein n=1 Tax=Phytohabitans rumicis TaxID=1076125 RepID=A0A6V8LG46_9ACTN|nr:hypothetical protein Prum_072210 [Phytohabitans rumicis]